MGLFKSFNSDRLFGIAAFFISVGTFVIYVYEARLIQKQQYASALPYLEMWNSSPNQSTYKLILVNNGIGPAFIKDVCIQYKGKVYKGDHVDFYGTIVYPKDTIDFTSTNIRIGRVIPAGQSIEIIDIENSEKNAAKMKNLFGNQTAKVEITYASVYEETWKLTGMSNPPQRLDE